MNRPSQKAQNLIEDYIESAGDDRAIFEYIADLEEALRDVTVYADIVGSKHDAVHVAVMKRAREVLP